MAFKHAALGLSVALGLGAAAAPARAQEGPETLRVLLGIAGRFFEGGAADGRSGQHRLGARELLRAQASTFCRSLKFHVTEIQVRGGAGEDKCGIGSKRDARFS